MGNINSRGNDLAQIRRNSLPFTVGTSKQMSSSPKVGCLLCSIARFYDPWDGSLDKQTLRDLVTSCGQYGYRAQVTQHPIYYIHITTITRKLTVQSSLALAMILSLNGFHLISRTLAVCPTTLHTFCPVLNYQKTIKKHKLLIRHKLAIFLNSFQLHPIYIFFFYKSIYAYLVG